MAWTTDDFVDAVRREGFLPDAHDMGASDILAIGDEENAGILADIWKGAREEFGVTVADLPLVSGTTRYRIPRRSLARGVRGISFVDAAGQESPATELPAMEAWRYGTRSSATYYFEADEIVLTADPGATATSLRVRYYVRPPRMVPLASCAAITAATALQLTLAGTVPAALSDAGSLVDIVRGDSPFGTTYADLVTGSIIGAILVLDASTPIDPDEVETSGANGARVDYLCPRDCTAYPPLPQELHPVLVSATLRRVLEALGDAAGASAAEATLRRRTQAATAVLEPRNTDRKPAIIARGGALRGRGRARIGWSR